MAWKKLKKNIEKQFEELKNNFSSDFKIFRESIVNELYVKIEILNKDINKIDKKTWEELKNNYKNQKNNIKERILVNFNNKL